LLLVGQIDQMGLILQIIFQKWSLLKLIPEGFFFKGILSRRLAKHGRDATRGGLASQVPPG